MFRLKRDLTGAVLLALGPLSDCQRIKRGTGSADRLECESGSGQREETIWDNFININTK